MRRSWLFFIFAAILAGGAIVGCTKQPTSNQQPISKMEVIDEAYEVIQEHAVYPVKKDMLIEGALRGMADTIGDPYSTYLTAEEAAAHRESLAGERVGIGAEVTRTNGKYIIVAPVKGGPAEKAGLQPYDEIVRINGERIEGESLQNVVQRIRGKKGSEVKLTIYRPEKNKHIEFSITRDNIPVTSVSTELIEERDQKLGYISLTMFGEESAKEWEKATSDLIQKGAQGLIIDVRGNPGGYLYAVSEIAGSLLGEDTVFAFMQDSTGAMTPLVTEKSKDLEFHKQLTSLPVVLLQDSGSASASEVLSAALKDTKRGFLVGTTSFGKGTVQETMDLSNGGELKLSTNKWLTPKEKWIHGKGVPADIEVKQSILFTEHLQVVPERFQVGDYNEQIAYAQRLLQALDYPIERLDGYFDEDTAAAVHAFRADKQIAEDKIMDRPFFAELKSTVEAYRKDRTNDEQLQMAIGYMIHQLEK